MTDKNAAILFALCKKTSLLQKKYIYIKKVALTKNFLEELQVHHAHVGLLFVVRRTPVSTFDILIIQYFLLGRRIHGLGNSFERLLKAVQQALNETPGVVRVHAVIARGSSHQQRGVATSCRHGRVDIVVCRVGLQEGPVLWCRIKEK